MIIRASISPWKDIHLLEVENKITKRYIAQFELASGQFSPSCTAAVRNEIRRVLLHPTQKGRSGGADVVSNLYMGI